MLVFFDPSCELSPLYVLSSSPPPPFLCEWVQVYSVSVYMGGGDRAVWRTYTGLYTTVCIWPDSEPSKFLYHPKQKPRREGASDRQTPAAKYLYWSKRTFRAWCLYRYFVHVLHTKKRIHPHTGGRDHGEGLFVKKRAQNYLDLKLYVYQLIEAGGWANVEAYPCICVICRASSSVRIRHST